MTAASTTDVVVDDVHSPVLQAGPPHVSEAVVFVHGNPGPKEDWSDLLALVGEFARAVAPDMPGYGAADKPRSFDYTADGYGEHLAGVLDQLAIRRAHLVLHDFGGPWGLAWAARHPEAFASVTLIGTGVLVGYHWHRYARIWRTPILGELFQATATRRGFRFLLGRENPRLPREAIDRIYESTRPWATKRAILKLYRATPERAFTARPHPRSRRSTVPPWSCGRPKIPTCLSSRQSVSVRRSRPPTSSSSKVTATGHF